jgi:hypothetical protein
MPVKTADIFTASSPFANPAAIVSMVVKVISSQKANNPFWNCEKESKDLKKRDRNQRYDGKNNLPFRAKLSLIGPSNAPSCIGSRIDGWVSRSEEIRW